MLAPACPRTTQHYLALAALALAMPATLDLVLGSLPRHGLDATAHVNCVGQRAPGQICLNVHGRILPPRREVLYHIGT